MNLENILLAFNEANRAPIYLMSNVWLQKQQVLPWKNLIKFVVFIWIARIDIGIEKIYLIIIG